MRLGFLVKIFGLYSDEEGHKGQSKKIRAIMEMRSPKNVKEVRKLTGKVRALNRFLARFSNRCERLFKLLIVGSRH